MKCWFWKGQDIKTLDCKEMKTQIVKLPVVKLTDDMFVDQDLTNMARDLINAGYQVMIQEYSSQRGKKTYFHYSNGKDVAYCEGRRFGGLRFASVRKPSKEHGTGSSHQDYMQYLPDVPVEQAIGYLDEKYYTRYAKYRYQDLQEYTEKSLGRKVLRLLEL